MSELHPRLPGIGGGLIRGCSCTASVFDLALLLLVLGLRLQDDFGSEQNLHVVLDVLIAHLLALLLLIQRVVEDRELVEV